VTTLLQDIRFAARQLRRTPVFTLTVLLTLALGIGANAAIFTLVNAVLLKNLPVADPKTLLRLGDRNDCCVGGATKLDGDYSLFSTDTYLQLKHSAPEFEELAAMQAGFGYRPIIARRDGAQTLARSVMGEFVSGNYFRTFGLQPTAGRLLKDSDDVAGAPMTAILSYDSWQHQYNADPAVVGSTFWINTKPVTIVGIAPQGFYGDRLATAPPEFYLPIQSMTPLANVTYVDLPNVKWLYIVGRIKPGVAVEPLQQKLSTLLRAIFAPDPRFVGARGQALLAKAHLVLTPGGAGIQAMQQEYAAHLHLLQWIAGAVLLIASANIANLLLVRGMARRAEMSLRTALGAMRARIVRQLLTESLLLATLGGLAGLVVAYAGARMLMLLAFPGEQNVPIHASPSPTVIGFAFGLALLTGVLFGIAPALMAIQAQPADVLRSGTRTSASGASLLQRSLVVLQSALSLVLLVGAGLFAQSLNKMQSTDLKLESKNRYIVHINPQAAGYATTQVEALYRTIEDRFHAIPGVVKVGLATYTPMEDNNWGTGFQIQGQPQLNVLPSFAKANSEYFDSVGTHVIMGRGFGPQDTSTSRPVAVLNQALVKKAFAGRNPIGAHIGTSDSGPHDDYEVVGVVENTAYQNVESRDNPMYFVPMTQRPFATKEPIEEDAGLYAGAMVIQTSRPNDDMESLARTTLAAINPNLSVVKFQTFDQQIADRFSAERMISRLTELFGALALLLATLGLYGVTAYTVARRTSEIGIRMALGQERASVVVMILRGALTQAAIGLAVGIPIALLSVRFIKSQLYEIAAADLTVLGGATATLAIAACLAGLIPARRAASTNPVEALRME